MYKIIERASDLPSRIPDGAITYLDCESTNITDKGKPADTMVWHGDRLCGVAFTHDDNSDCYYIPVRHTSGINIPVDSFQRWLRDLFAKTNTWINHNIKFDMHLVAKEGVYLGPGCCFVVDTMTQARIIHNNLPKYGLKELSALYLGVENWKDGVKEWLVANKSKNWADVPVSIMGPYACSDVDNNRALHLKFNKLMPEECGELWAMEKLLTPVLYDLECQGIPVDPDELAEEVSKSESKQGQLQTALEGRIGHEINVNSNVQLKQLLLDELGLPIVSTTDKGNPSFGAEAMGLYESLPEVLTNENIRGTLNDIAALVEEKHFYSLFLKEYSDLHVDGIIHPTYLQCKKTGRMGCKQPNSQQLNTRAKRFAKCLPGHNIWSWDESQIEYRLITHYTGNQRAIKAYNNDPWTDYHTWVAELANITRKPAKTLNFLMAFGGGLGKAMEFLAKIDEVIDEVNVEVDTIMECDDALESVHDVSEPTDRAGIFRMQFDRKARAIYNAYHAAQPELKDTMYRASRVVEQRGYVKTIMNRRSYIPKDLSYKAFNAVIQGSAADIFKDRLITYAPRYNKTVRDWGIKPFAVVHDDIVSQVPVDIDEAQYVEYTAKTLQDVPFDLSVPIMVANEKHTISWGE